MLAYGATEEMLARANSFWATVDDAVANQRKFFPVQLKNALLPSGCLFATEKGFDNFALEDDAARGRHETAAAGAGSRDSFEA